MSEPVEKMLAAWDGGDTVWSIELGGLGPGYEQAIQVAAIEFARACKDMEGIIPNDRASTERFRTRCNERLHEIDDQLGGLSGAMMGAATWLAWQWCFNGGPDALQVRAKEQGKDKNSILISKAWPKVQELAEQERAK